MLRNFEDVAMQAGLHFTSVDDSWTCQGDWPHIAPFAYQLTTYDGAADDFTAVGRIDGYRVTQDWTVESELQLWDEADALDGDVVGYVDALIRELRACEEVFDSAPNLTLAQRTTIVRHVEIADGLDSAALTQGAVASIAMMDAPVLMLVDPWPMAEQRRSAAGKLAGRGHIPKLLELGFVRMVGSRFLWAWNRELSELLMADYAYDELLAAKQRGTLDTILTSRLSEELHGPIPDDLADMIRFPNPEDSTTE